MSYINNINKNSTDYPIHDYRMTELGASAADANKMVVVNATGTGFEFSSALNVNTVATKNYVDTAIGTAIAASY